MSAALSLPLARHRDEPVGLLAAWGRFPFAFADKARETGLRVSCVALRGLCDPALAERVWRFHWCGPIRIGEMSRKLRRDGVRRMVMAGKVNKAELIYHPWKLLHLRPDWKAIKTFYFRKDADNRDDSLLLLLVRAMAEDGLTMASALDLCPELLVGNGTLTRRGPSRAELADIDFGWGMAKAMGGLDVGQSVAVKDGSVVAVEAIEGTDRAILRAGELCRKGGFVVVKVAKPNQDMRFDVPTVGCTTVETMHKAGGRVLAVEAGKTILLDEAETVRLADRLGITIVAMARKE
jgi:DUF1009 family protein